MARAINHRRLGICLPPLRKPSKAQLQERREHGISDALDGLAFRREYDGWDAVSQEAYEFGRLCALGAWGPFTRTGAAQ